MVTASEFLSGCSKQATARGFIELLQLKQWNLKFSRIATRKSF